MVLKKLNPDDTDLIEVERELPSGDLDKVKIPLSLFKSGYIELHSKKFGDIKIPWEKYKSAWARHCALQRETFSGGRNGGIRKPESTRKRLATIAASKPKKKTK